jgi:hypothetical protein
MFLRTLTVAGLLAAPGLALAQPETKVIRLDSPGGADKLLAQEAENGHGPPAQGLWTKTTVSVDPKTGAKTTLTIVASHPVPNPPPKSH